MFELSDNLFAAVNNGSAANLYQGWLRLQRELPPHRYSPFLRNHDQTRTLTALGGDGTKAKVAATLLLTLPGLPFVYYGEEIGMTGDKPDEQLRTPMQWAPAPAGGFSTAKAWEAQQPDSMTVTVAAQDKDSSSLLNHYRRLMNLRAVTPALTQGDIVPLDAGNDAVVAYARRMDKQVVVVVANLGAEPLRNVALRSADAVGARGRYVTRALAGGVRAAPVTIGADGRLAGYVPFAELSARQAYVFALRPALPR